MVEHRFEPLCHNSIGDVLLIFPIGKADFGRASVDGWGDDDAGRDALIKLWHMGDNAYQSSFLPQTGQRLDGAVQALRVEAAKAFVDKHRLNLDAACILLYHFGKTQRQRERGFKAFAARQGGNMGAASRCSCP